MAGDYLDFVFVIKLSQELFVFFNYSQNYGSTLFSRIIQFIRFAIYDTLNVLYGKSKLVEK